MGHVLSDVRYLHDTGCSVVEISGITGMKRPLIYYWLDQWGLQPHITRRPNLTEFQLGRIFKLYRSGMTQAKIAREMDIPPHQVWYAMRVTMTKAAT